MRTCALAAVLWAALAAAEPQMIFWGGGKSAADGDAAAADWKVASPLLLHLFAPGPGYPKLVDTSKVAGLEPGSHLLALGVCSAPDVALRLQVLKPASPRAFALPVRVAADSVECPRVPAD